MGYSTGWLTSYFCTGCSINAVILVSGAFSTTLVSGGYSNILSCAIRATCVSYILSYAVMLCVLDDILVCILSATFVSTILDLICCILPETDDSDGNLTNGSYLTSGNCWLFSQVLTNFYFSKNLYSNNLNSDFKFEFSFTSCSLSLVIFVSLPSSALILSSYSFAN